MTRFRQVQIHPSMHPDRRMPALLDALQKRVVPGRCHYEGLRQTQQWLNLYRNWSPHQNDPDFRKVYQDAFERAAACFANEIVRVVGLGCGNADKELALIRLLHQRNCDVLFYPCDVSIDLVLMAAEQAEAWIPPQQIEPIVADLERADRPLPEEGDTGVRNGPRLLTLFGMIPNFAPGVIWPRLAGWLGPDDRLIFSVHLAPGEDYRMGVEQVLPQYDNSETRSWLGIFLGAMSEMRKSP